MRITTAEGGGCHALESLRKIQEKLKAPKGQYNSFGKYAYRSAEDILEAVKPLANELECVVLLSDRQDSGDGDIRGAYIEAEATVASVKDGSSVSVSAQAGIDLNRKGMDVAQSYGSSSSYARKYAMNGLFAIDDTKDADATNTHGKGGGSKPTPAAKPAPAAKPNLSAAAFDNMVKAVTEDGDAGIAKVKQYLPKYSLSADQRKRFVELKVIS